MIQPAAQGPHGRLWGQRLAHRCGQAHNGVRSKHGPGSVTGTDGSDVS